MIDLQHKFSIMIKSMKQDIAWRYSPTLAWISYRRETFAKVSLLALGFLFLVRLASLLLRTRT
jgi:hypothetical protein